MVEGRTLFRVVLSLPVNQPSHAIEVAVPEEEKQQLLRFLWKMKNSNGNTSGSAASTISTHRGSIGEVTAEELLRDTVFRDPEHRYHHTW